jgi:hypothetical protein
MKYQKLYQKYKAKYLELKMQQTGGRDMTSEEKLTHDFLKNSPGDDINAVRFAAQIDSEQDRNPAKTSTKSSGPTFNLMYPLHVSSHTLRPGDRVMKTSYTSDPLGGVIGDRGTITSIDFLNDLVAVQFDRLYSPGIVSYVSPSVLTQVYDPIPRLHQKKPKVKVVIDDDDDDDMFDDEDDYDVEYKVKSKKSSKKRSKKSSKKSKKSKKSSKKSKKSKK